MLSVLFSTGPLVICLFVCFVPPPRGQSMPRRWSDPPEQLAMLLAAWEDIFMARGTGFVQGDSGRGSGSGCQCGAAKLFPLFLYSVSGTVGFKNVTLHLSFIFTYINMPFSLCLHTGLEKLLYGCGWGDQEEKGLTRLRLWSQVLHGGPEVVTVMEGVLRWAWGHRHSGERLRVLDDTASSVRKT